MTASTPGQLFVVAAPSGAGKSSLVKALRAQVPGLHLSVSHTTRAPRGQEQNGREYHFVDAPTFERMVADGAFIEWARVHGNCYGTSRTAIATRLDAGEDLLLEIDFQGALQIKRLFSDAALVFVLPPSWAELERRITGRGEDAPAVIAQRMAAARDEVAQAPQFDYVIINGSFDDALADLQSIVRAQRLRYGAQARHQAATFAALDLS